MRTDLTVGRFLALAALMMVVLMGAAEASPSRYYDGYSNSAEWENYWDGTSFPSPVLPGKLLYDDLGSDITFRVNDWSESYNMTTYIETENESGWFQVNGLPQIDYTWKTVKDYNTDSGTIYLNIEGKDFTSTFDISRGEDELDALEKISSEVVDWLIALFASGVENGSDPNSALHRSMSIIMNQVLIPAKLPGVMRSPKESRGGVQAMVNEDGTPIVAQVPTSVVTWNTSANSALRYEHVWYDDVDADGDRLGATFHYNRMWDRFSLDVIVPIDRMWFDGDYEAFEFTRLGLNLTPRYYALFQEENGFDLTLGVNAFYFHTFLDEDTSDDPDHLGFGPTLSFQKDFEKASLNAGLVFQRAWNAEGGTEITGEQYVDALQFGVNVGVPVGERFVANMSAIYSYTFDVPSTIDDDYVTVGLGGTWVVSDKWILDATVRSNLGYNEADNVELHVGMSWAF